MEKGFLNKGLGWFMLLLMSAEHMSVVCELTVCLDGAGQHNRTIKASN